MQSTKTYPPAYRRGWRTRWSRAGGSRPVSIRRWQCEQQWTLSISRACRIFYNIVVPLFASVQNAIGRYFMDHTITVNTTDPVPASVPGMSGTAGGTTGVAGAGDSSSSGTDEPPPRKQKKWSDGNIRLFVTHIFSQFLLNFSQFYVSTTVWSTISVVCKSTVLVCRRRRGRAPATSLVKYSAYVSCKICQ